MQARKLMIPVFVLLLAVSGLARALDIQPYTANALQQAQASGKPVAVQGRKPDELMREVERLREELRFRMGN